MVVTAAVLLLVLLALLLALALAPGESTNLESTLVSWTFVAQVS